MCVWTFAVCQCVPSPIKRLPRVVLPDGRERVVCGEVDMHAKLKELEEKCQAGYYQLVE